MKKCCRNCKHHKNNSCKYDAIKVEDCLTPTTTKAKFEYKHWEQKS